MQPDHSSIRSLCARAREVGSLADRDERRALKLPWAYTESFDGKGPEGRKICN